MCAACTWFIITACYTVRIGDEYVCAFMVGGSVGAVMVKAVKLEMKNAN